MDGMTIDEVIKYFDDDAKENEKLAIIYRGNDDDLAEMHKQDAIRSSYVAEWLRELKALKENDDVKDVFMDCDTCKYLSLECDDYPCDRCCHRYNNQYVYDDKREVNADE